ncbi:hypothetical protein J1N35_028665 [Gossypium stocksii]|uniref:Reverse transcriptase zinc-binding domain-containing protein n=1 Tax=Gossypium stocksii TaxID=47602 RepID=A0A9D3UWM0_9ROSI|nr:hypothetical protein J1N35_028665 [Gossypium stocksii]
MIPKIKVFSWRIGHNILPTLNNIARIRQGCKNTCPRCNSKEETLLHALKDCPKAREILVAGGLNNNLIDGEYNHCIDWLEDMFRELDSKAAADFLTLIWNSWNDRNNMVFKVEHLLSTKSSLILKFSSEVKSALANSVGTLVVDYVVNVEHWPAMQHVTSSIFKQIRNEAEPRAIAA